MGRLSVWFEMALARLNVSNDEDGDSGVLGVGYRFALASLCKLDKSVGPKRRLI